MTVRLLTAPATLAVSLEEAKTNLRIDDDSQDTMVTAWVQGITDHAEHYMGRSIIHQVWRLTLDIFPDAIRLPHPPIVSVTSVKYLDENGTQQTLDPDDYLVDSMSEPGYIVPAPNKAWPTTYDRINAVIVEYVAGYGVDSSSTPAAIKSYLLAKLVEQFDPAVRPEKETVQSSFIDRLLDRYKIWNIG